MAAERLRCRDRASVAVLVLVLVGLVLRLAWVAWVGRDPTGLNDPVNYLLSGASIADGDGFRNFAGDLTAYYPIGYPAFVGVVTWLVVHTPLPDQVGVTVGVIQAFLGAATVLLSAGIARRLVSPGAGVATAAVLALWPNLIFHTGVLLGETLFNLLFVAAVAVLVARPWPSGGPSAARMAAVGALLGAAVLVRPVVLVVVPFLVLAMVVAGVGWRPALRGTGVALGLAAVVVAPWTVRNAVVLDAFVPVSTNTGDNLCIGRFPGATGWFAFSEECGAEVAGVDDGTAQEPARDRRNTRLALEWAVDDPVRELTLVGWRAYHTFRGDHDALWAANSYDQDPQLSDRTSHLLGVVADGWYWTMLGLGAIGARALLDRRDGRRLFVLAAAVSSALVPLAFFGDMRFHVPAVPLWAIAAGIALSRLPAVLLTTRR
ncbi:hypothetical protein BH20ACT2_BH20ACT2_06060 [soil metagenome]